MGLLDIKPHQVSRDLRGYSVFFYGAPKTGKTTTACKFPGALLLAFEKGYSTIPGIYPQPINSWSEFKKLFVEFKDPAVQKRYQTIVIDTADIAADACQKYICNQLGIENIGDGGWATNGWAKVKREWEQTFRAVTMEGYALVFISHSKDKTFTRKDNTTYNQIVPSCSTAYNEIIKNMSDIMGYIEVEHGERKLILRSNDESVDCKCRFKYIEPEITFGYQNLVDALNRAIDAEANATDNKFVTDERSTFTSATTYDYDVLKAEFNDLVSAIMTKNQSNAPKITAIVDKYLGKNKKVAEAIPEQAELIHLINIELKEDLL